MAKDSKKVETRSIQKQHPKGPQSSFTRSKDTTSKPKSSETQKRDSEKQKK